MASTTAPNTSSPLSFLGKLFSGHPSRLSGINGSIYTHMCVELEPEHKIETPVEAWNASIDPAAQRLRYRSDSEVSSVSTRTSTSTNVDVNVNVNNTTVTHVDGSKTAVFESIPRWQWPESTERMMRVKVERRISEPLRPEGRV